MNLTSKWNCFIEVNQIGSIILYQIFDVIVIKNVGWLIEFDFVFFGQYDGERSLCGDKCNPNMRPIFA